ncbi:hypothetical protein CTAYLR_003067 [Chrysophaeum taylorii]|uniref:Elongation factor Tu, chloroplastic n=1 Tax=Chrysophaeum taylorii TaxID=2483200 RepID=A0AAD7XGP4_9STRA|nr:hypothetical protein CTAYLR_003067 [Chrysophaeum taylorii]
MATLLTARRPGPRAHFDQEDDEGNCEYKLSLASAKPERVRHLVTQLLFRLNEGGGRALYRLGVRDDGTAEGLRESELRASLRTLRDMAQSLGARVAACSVSDGTRGLVAEVRVEASSSSRSSSSGVLKRGDDAGFARWVDEPSCRASSHHVNEENRCARVCVIGAISAGKSTLVSVLATRTLDDGRGLARAKVLRHGHEVAAHGRTSAISEVAARGCVLLDLAGHEKYLKTTIFGLTSRSPDAALLVVDARDAIEEPLRRMTLEHLGVALALKLRVIVALTHADCLALDERETATRRIDRLLGRNAAAAEPVIFVVSSVTGEGCDDLREALAAIRPAADLVSRREQPLVRVHGAHRVDRVGLVLFGTVHDGTVSTGDLLLLGPLSDGWHRVELRSIRLSPTGTPVSSVDPGRSAAFALGSDCDAFLEETPRGVFFRTSSEARRRPACGVVLLHPERPAPPPCLRFHAELLVLSPPNRRKGLYANYESVVHAHAVRQAARITTLNGPDLVAGRKAECTLSFLYHPEFITPGTTIILRDGRTRAVGTVLCLGEVHDAGPAHSPSRAT